jgi:hypothetical protein
LLIERKSIANFRNVLNNGSKENFAGFFYHAGNINEGITSELSSETIFPPPPQK